jgi:hypothetical protein
VSSLGVFPGLHPDFVLQELRGGITVSSCLWVFDPA